MNKNDKVTIEKGTGYTWNDNGIMKFRRAENDLSGTVIDFLPKNQVYILLEDNRKVITSKHTVKVQ